MPRSKPGDQSLRTSQFYDSRATSAAGIGFPSASRELVLAPRNTVDPHGYYQELGVDPGASRDEIRAAAHALYRRLHPDLADDPDPERLQRVKDIADVLLDDAKRLKYDRTPQGERLMDKVFAEELRKSGLLNRMDERQVRETIKTQAASHPYGVPGRFDYFSMGYKTTDGLKAQQWYHYLITQLLESDYRGRLRLCLWDNQRPAWEALQEVIMVPRTWEPSAFAAKTLVTRVIGARETSNLTEAPETIPTL